MWHTREELGVFLGYCSIACWIPVTFPELLEIWHLKSAEAISLPFVILWSLGDLCNLIGCILTGQLETQTLLATWYVFADSIMISMCLYFDSCYVARDHDNEERKPLKSNGSQRLNMHSWGLALCFMICGGALMFLQHDSNHHLYNSRVLLSYDMDGNKKEISPELQKFGQVIAWISTSLYLIAKWPQVHRNYMRKSTDGLSAKMFILCIGANIFYISSIFVHSTERDYLMNSLPYIIGGLTAPFDLTILFQIWYYNNHYPKKHGFELPKMPELPPDATPNTRAYARLVHAATLPAPHLDSLPGYYHRPILTSVRSGGMHHMYNVLTHMSTGSTRPDRRLSRHSSL